MRKFYKQILTLLMLIFLSASIGYAQVDVTATGGTTSASYTTLKLAFDAINAGTHTGTITIGISANTTEGTTPANLNSSGAGSASYTSILIQPTVDGVSISGNPVTGFGVIQLNGADNVTINGDNPNTSGTNRNLSVNNTTTTTVIANSCIRLATSAAVTSCDNNTIKNCILNGNVTGGNLSTITSTTGSSNSSFGIYCGGNGGATVTGAPTAITSVTSNTAPSGTTINSLLIDNNAISQCARAIVFNGVAATVSTGVSITNNTIGASGTQSGAPPYTSPSTTVYTKAIWMNGLTAATISGNTIQNILSYVGTTMTAIETSGAIGAGLLTISGNTISTIVNNGTSPANGIQLASSSGTYTISNNIISSIQAVGSSCSAITCGTTATSATIENNNITTVRARSTGGVRAGGIVISSGNSVTIQNNFIAEVLNIGSASFGNSYNANGILLAGGNNHKVYYNSVNLFGVSTSVGSNSINCLSISASTQTGIDVRNNIFSNTVTGGASTDAHTCVFLPFTASATMLLTLNNNAYFSGTVAASGIAFAGASSFAIANLYTAANFNPGAITPATNFRSFSTALGVATNDNASFASTAAAPFQTPTNLHIPALTSTQIESGGVVVSTTTDIDGQNRYPVVGYPDNPASPAIAPDMGADEFAGTKLAAPVADFSADFTAPIVAQKVIFTDLSTNSPTAWLWAITPGTYTLLDGTTLTSQNPHVKFDAAGAYDISLTATNFIGSNTNTKIGYINAANPSSAPVADFSANTLIKQTGQTIIFTDLSTNYPTSWLWAFTGGGTATYVDGTSATSQNPHVQFSATGSVTVALTATNYVGSNTNTKNNYLTIVLSYCVPTYSSGGASDYMTLVTLGTLSQATSSNVSPYYIDYTSTQNAIPNLQQGISYNLSITFAGDATQYNGVWIDFNQDGTLGTTEFFTSGTNAGANGTAVVSIAVPAGATLGLTRMRIRGGDDNQPLNTQACNASASNYGQGQDYFVNVVVATLPNLVVAPNSFDFGYIPSGSFGYNQYVLSGTNLTGAPGNIVVSPPAGFEVSPDGLAPWTGYPSSINVAYNAATLGNTTIFVRFAPSGPPAVYSGNISNAGGGDSKNVAVTGTSMIVYCACASGGTSFEYIGGVVATGGINNTGTAHTTYSDFTAFVSNVQQSTNMTVTVSSGGTWYTGDAAYVFIDYNQDGDFSDVGELAGTGTGSVSPYNISFTIPITATLGSTRMRIKFGETPNMTNSPCQTGYTYGETEDYTVNITAPPSCLPPTAQATSNYTTVGADLSWTSPDSFFDIFIQSAGLPAPGVGTPPTVNDYNTGSPSNWTYTWTGGSSSTTYDWYVRTDCAAGSGTGQSTWTGPNTFSTVFSNPTPCGISIDIPDAQCPTATLIEIAVSGAGGTNLGTDVVLTGVDVIIDHTWDGDLAFAVYSPNNVQVLLANANGGSGDDFGNPLNCPTQVCNFNMCGANGLISSGTAPFIGSYIPLGNFNDFNDGSNPNGYWYFLICDGASGDDGTVEYVALTFATPAGATTWTGTTSNAWSLCSNWTNGIPAPATDVTIPAGLTNYPTLTAAGACNDIFLGSTIAGTATLLDNSNLTVNGTATVERYYASGATWPVVPPDDEWHLISSPISNAQAGIYNSYYLQWFEEGLGLGTWHDIITVTDPMNPLQGYALYVPSDGMTFNYIGNLNTGIVTIPVSAHGLDPLHWNLLGNPYPSSLDWDLVQPLNISNMWTGAVYYLDQATGAYLSYNAGVGAGSRYVPPEQGFFVAIKAEPNVFTVNNSMRTHTGGSNYYKAEFDNLLVLEAAGNNYSDAAYLRFDATATPEVDYFDAFKLFTSTNPYLPQLYTMGGNNLSINVLPETEMVPAGFKAGVPGEYTINIKDVTGMPNVVLEDIVTGIKTDLLNGSYTFNYNLNDPDNRFIIHFTPLGVSENPVDLVNIYSSQKDVYVNVPLNTIGDIVIYNLMGQEVTRTRINGVLNKVTLAESAYYVVKVMSDESVVTKKVFVK
jgi:PKD repeat protein